MARIFSIVALAAITACTFVGNLARSVAAPLFSLAPALFGPEPFHFANTSPRSIFETRRAGMA